MIGSSWYTTIVGTALVMYFVSWILIKHTPACRRGTDGSTRATGRCFAVLATASLLSLVVQMVPARLLPIGNVVLWSEWAFVLFMADLFGVLLFIAWFLVL